MTTTSRLGPGRAEVARCRRFGRQLSLLVLEPTGRSRRRRSAMTSIARELEHHVRFFDKVLVDSPSRRVVLVAPEVGEAETAQLWARIRDVLVAADHDVRVGWASMPADGALLPRLVEQAASRLDETPAATPELVSVPTEHR